MNGTQAGGDRQVPAGLGDKGKEAAETIVAFLQERGIATTPDKVLFTPEEWSDRGERYGVKSLLVIIHDGGDHARAFDWERQNYELIEALADRLAPLGVYVEQCTGWYSAVYPI